MSVEKSVKNYELWHQKHPDRVVRMSNKHLDEKDFCTIGRAVQIIYKSDKWEEDGNVFTYDHDFSSAPSVYCPASHVDIVGGYRHRNNLLGHAHTNPFPATMLAHVVSLDVMDAEGEIFALTGVSKARLLCTPDRKALIIPTRSTVFIIRGGKMRVTERGIVK